MSKIELKESIEKMCDDYLLAILPKNCSKVQATETRRAFLAGMFQLSVILKNNGNLSNALYHIMSEKMKDIINEDVLKRKSP